MTEPHVAKITAFNPALGTRHSALPPSKHDQLVAQTEKWVAQSFYGELLKQVRNNPFKSELFSGGRGGEAFGSMQDQQMAEHMTRGAGKKLVNAIVRQIEARTAYNSQKRSEDTMSQLNAPRKVEATPSTDAGGSSRNVRAHVAPLP
jgi:Rod binding domain-containing protein